jgi:AcrR family transcriptional regulator
VVDATIHLVATQGTAGFTIRKIAAVARLSPSSVTSHLENKARMTGRGGVAARSCVAGDV